MESGLHCEIINPVTALVLTKAASEPESVSRILTWEELTRARLIV